MNRELRAELERLLSRLYDDQLDDTERDRLEFLLRDDPECRRFYLAHVDMHACLGRGEHAGAPLKQSTATTGIGAAPHAPQPNVDARGAVTPALSSVARVVRSWPLGALAPAAAAAVGAALIWWVASASVQPPPAAGDGVAAPLYVATLRQADGCRWVEGSSPRNGGDRIAPSTLALASGDAEVVFDLGARLTLRGPAELRVTSAASATLVYGAVSFSSDETAPPFSLRTPDSVLVDVGTEFAVVVGDDGEEVHVFDGEVRRTPLSSDEPVDEMTAGTAMRFARRKGVRPKRVALDRAHLAPLASSSRRVEHELVETYDGLDYAGREISELALASQGRGWDGPWFVDLDVRDSHAPGEVRFVPDDSARTSTIASPSEGAVELRGQARLERRLAAAVRLDEDHVYYLSWLVRPGGVWSNLKNTSGVSLRSTGEPRDRLRDHRMSFNLCGGRGLAAMHILKSGSRAHVPLEPEGTYRIVVKLVAGKTRPDQAMLRVFFESEPLPASEPEGWTMVSAEFYSDAVFDVLSIQSHAVEAQRIDELRLAPSWNALFVDRDAARGG